jgi:type IV secretory pathway TrbF-like protein
MFGKQKHAPGTAGDAENPYLNARRTWNDHTGGLAQSRRLWQLQALLSSMIVLGCVGGLIDANSKSKFVPYVVKVSDLGQPVAVAPADRAQPVDSRVAQAQVASFIDSARSITADVTIERRNVFRVYAMLQQGDAATVKMSEWFNANPPMTRAATQTVEVQVTSVIPQSPTTWQVDWVETVRDRSGQPSEAPIHMRALVTVAVRAPTSQTTEEMMRANPLGLYVSDYSWSKVV